MTLFDDHRGSELLTWSSPAPRLWVASTPTQYVGMVEHLDDGFAASGPSSEDLGVHDSLEQARLAAYRAWNTVAAA
jgi:hypothetical protein